MSHYTVMVIVKDPLKVMDANKAFAKAEEMLAPFNESVENLSEEQLEFCDVTTEIENDFIEYNNEHETKINKLEEYACEYCGYMKNNDKFGYWRNPNAKWDWYSLGGRWENMIPVYINNEDCYSHNSHKNNFADMSRIKNVNFDKIEEITLKNLNSFWEKLPPTDMDIFTQMTASKLGIDVDNLNISKEVFMEKYKNYFNTFKTYAVLDENGWHAPGEMGWFGMSSDSPEDKLSFCNSFYDNFIKDLNKNDWIIIVDCHI